ncbi:MAG TPA: hypothetical protein VNZ52_15690 [Candidatus Thermoplasmatota archaeon]|nr:hypothetical protein [Candidatus Thermoplasmatota archaeon]
MTAAITAKGDVIVDEDIEHNVKLPRIKQLSEALSLSPEKKYRGIQPTILHKVYCLLLDVGVNTNHRNPVFGELHGFQAISNANLEE